MQLTALCRTEIFQEQHGQTKANSHPIQVAAAVVVGGWDSDISPFDNYQPFTHSCLLRSG